MKYERYNEKTCNDGTYDHYRLTIYRHGLFEFSYKLHGRLGLKGGDFVEFLRNKKGQWYLCRSDAKHGFQLFTSCNKGGLSFKSKVLREQIKEDLFKWMDSTVQQNIDLLVDVYHPEQYENQSIYKLLTK